MEFLKDPRFWGGVIVGYLLVHLMPQLSLKGKIKGGS
jgi:hypothetical protein